MPLWNIVRFMSERKTKNKLISTIPDKLSINMCNGEYIKQQKGNLVSGEAVVPFSVV